MRKIFKAIQNEWDQYKYRFVPWQILNWKSDRTTVRRIEKSIDLEAGKEEEICANLIHLFNEFDKAERVNRKFDDVLYEINGFSLEKRQSLIKDAGDGIFVSKGTISKNAVAALYPGTIYYPSDPMFFQSINNPFILRCLDGIMIDGNHRGLSKSIFRSCCGRDIIGSHKPCDTSWLTDASKNPLAIGQFVNNQSSESSANVIYQEVDIPISLPLNLRKFLPNVYYRSKFLENASDTPEDEILTRIVVLISLSQININEELYSAYFTEVF